jgi:hypothetical protein
MCIQLVLLPIQSYHSPSLQKLSYNPHPHRIEDSFSVGDMSNVYDVYGSRFLDLDIQFKKV